jgi:hypothetical protein
MIVQYIQDNGINSTELLKIAPYCKNCTGIQSDTLGYHLSALSIDKDIIAWVKLHKGASDFLNKILAREKNGRAGIRLLLY